MRTPSPLTAIRRIRAELDRLETQFAKPKKTEMRASRKIARRGSVKQSCGVCGKRGHNSRRHAK